MKNLLLIALMAFVALSTQAQVQAQHFYRSSLNLDFSFTEVSSLEDYLSKKNQQVQRYSVDSLSTIESNKLRNGQIRETISIHFTHLTGELKGQHHTIKVYVYRTDSGKLVKILIVGFDIKDILE